MAHAMARENPKIKADVVEVTEFPQVSQKYLIRAVPKTVINDRVQFDGAVPERAFLQHVLKAIEPGRPSGAPS